MTVDNLDVNQLRMLVTKIRDIMFRDERTGRLIAEKEWDDMTVADIAIALDGYGLVPDNNNPEQFGSDAYRACCEQTEAE